MAVYKSVFSYYGGKSKIAHRYPPPTHDLIVEPFAGAAAYSLRYKEHQVWLNDPDPITYTIWQFLLSPHALGLVEEYLPEVVVKGSKIQDWLDPEAPEGLFYLASSQVNQGTQGTRGVPVQVTTLAESCWPRVKPKLRLIIPAIRHWRVTQNSYEEIPNQPATWFVDPPYANAAGRAYRLHEIDYNHLGGWCRGREGQVVVCENVGATWLPFEPLTTQRVGVKSRYQVSNTGEAVYIQ